MTQRPRREARVREGGVPAVSVDPRARRSKDALEAALLELVATKDLAQISVSDITKRAGLSRSTFYEHYTDVHSLAASACTVLFDELIEGSDMVDPRIAESTDSEDNPLIPVFGHFAENARLYRSLLGPDGSARVINHLLHRIRVFAYVNRRLVTAVPSTIADGPTDNPHDPEAAFVAGALIGTVVDWLRRGCPGTPEAMAATVWPQLLGGVSVNGLGPRQST
jgi:AcrR family transcriptional regulator